MLSFNLLEILFFLILGTTFVLILLLVYHFKKRVTDVEYRCDKMFTMLKCLAEEISNQNTHPVHTTDTMYPFNMNSHDNIEPFKNVNLNLKLPSELDLDDFEGEDDHADDDDSDNDDSDDDDSDDDEIDDLGDNTVDDDSDNDENDEESTQLENSVKLVELPDTEITLEVLRKMNVTELKNMATKKGIEGVSKMKKVDLINSLENI